MATLLPAIVAGCAAPALPTLPVAAPAQWRQAPGQTVAAPAPDLQSWWKALGDPQLDALVEQALAQNLTLAQARSRLRQARILAGRDNMAYRPSVSAGARTLQDVSATDTYFQASLDAVWELGLFGARESIQRAGQARLDTAAASTQAARVSLVAEVVRSYADLRAAQVQQDLLQHMADLDAQSLALFSVQRQQRLGAPEERAQAEIRIAQTRAQQSQPRQIAEHAAQGLAVLLGQATPDAAWRTASSWPPRSQPGLRDFRLQQVPTDLLRYRPEIRSAEADVLKSAAELGSATSELYPRITLGASLLYAHNITQNRRTNTDNVPALGPLIDIPLFDWGRRRAAVDAQKEALDASLLAYRQAVLEGVSETESALSALQLSGERRQQLQTARDLLARRVDDQATLARLGLASRLDGLGAERAALQASMEVAAAEAAHTQAFVALYKALGGAPIPADEADGLASRTAQAAP
ncbi:hypothetical protein RD110_04585 [Rhodoferax koreense]|uniref:RND transporter n=1 Tax=Rhodoferax koreensis TaxID=1842727 RepID=A0A1P8K392_9BURK|nr:hypothetical protein RD110_04585 [Rhodoferax koreense]